DGWSLRVLLRELTALYAGTALPELPVQYADFAAWQRAWLAGETLEAEIAWWRERLAGTPAVLELPADRPRPAVRTPRGGVAATVLPASLASSLEALGRRHGATLFMSLLAGFQLLLHHATGREDLPVGTPIANRNRAETEGLIGFFVNTLVLRGDLTGEPGFRTLLRRTRDTALAAYDHQDLPFEKLVEALQPERSLAHTPLFQVMLLFQNDRPSAASELAGLTLSSLPLESHTAKLDLTLAVAPGPRGELLVQAEHSRDLFDASTVRRLLEHFHVLMEQAITAPERPISSLSPLSEAERHEILLEWNDTAAPLAGPLCLHERFEAQAARTPGAIAVVSGKESLTYFELDRRAGRLARHLVSLGAGPESRVGIALERTPELIVGLLATLKAGAAYVPLDPAYPRERLALILEDAQEATAKPVLLTSSALLDRLPAFAGQVLCVDGGMSEEQGRAAPLPLVDPGHLAYLIYTSGSTGRPKGVAIEHRSAAALLDWAAGVFDEGELSGVAASTSVAFDLSVFEIFLPLTRGGTVLLAENALALPDLPAAGDAVLVNTVPSAIGALLTTGGLPVGVRTVNLAGEPLKRSLVDAIYATPTVERVYNLYGPSEDTTYSTFTRVTRDERREPTIGRPITGTRAHVLDRWLRSLPIGVPGELHLAGAGLARGYLKRPELTAASFIPDPFGEPGERLYRTGDLARRLPDGQLEFLGRIDHQVKIRGFRIELGEIEAHLTDHPMVREAVVLAREHAAEKSLTAFVMLRDGEAAGASGLRAFLQEKLPVHMVPSGFVILDTLPLTPNGKVDRKALGRLQPEEERGPAAGTAEPRTTTEELLAGLWSEILRRDHVGIHDDFFALGGHSLMATRVVSRVREVFRVEIPLRRFFETPTVAGLAAHLDAARRGPLPPPIVPVPRGRELPASFAQERLWFLEQLGDEEASYSLPFPLRLHGPLSAPALAAALNEVVRRHETLRTTFSTREGRVLQEITPALDLPLPEVDLRGLPEDVARAETLRVSITEARSPFDLQNGPLLRTTLLRLGVEKHALLLTMHHIVSDGWSLRVLLRELTALYAGTALPELPVQYADFAAWQRAWLTGETLEAEISWWRERLSGTPAVLELPADRPRPAVRTPRGGVAAAVLPASLASSLEALGRRHGATLFMTLLAGFQLLLHHATGREDLPVGTPIANRNRAESEGLIGFFVNTLVLRGDLTGDPGFRTLLRRTRDTALAAYDHQDLPFEKLVEALQPERSLAHTPLFQVMFLFQNDRPSAAPELAGLTLSSLPLESRTAKFDLTLAVAPGLGGEILVQAEHSRDLFDAPTVCRLLEHSQVLLEQAVAAPERPISSLSPLTEAQRHEILLEWNDSATPYPAHTVHELFAEQAARTPEAVAVACEGQSLTYAGLNAQANRLACHLRRLGVGPEVLVGICAERSLDLIVGLLGILKAGGAYLPLDPSLPVERLAFVVADGRLPVLLVQERFLPLLAGPQGETGSRVVLLDGNNAATGRESDAEPVPEAGPRNLAYVLYTSGSTGRPKGVAVEHRSIVRLVRGNGVDHRGPETFLQLAPVPFDASTLEIWAPLLNGGRLVVFPPRTPSLEELGETLRTEEISTLWLTAGLFHQMVEAQPESLAQVRRLLAGGDTLSLPHVRQVLERLAPGQRLINGYGPTEGTTFTCCHSMDATSRPLGSVPVGRPIPNTRVHLLNRDFRPVPIGVSGELYAAGDGLARGYLGRPDLTAERFVPAPFPVEPGERLYRTGDLARWLPTGEIEFLGRIDTQVKLRGFRIEPGEIEAALCNHEGVREAVILVREDRPGDRRLVAYVVAEARTGILALGATELRSHLSRHLPDYMIPAAFVSLGELPLTSNGKVDRR
ncbi:MAG TPA: amino acid adenylation domain-containing protein, partial [Thermoanaerobaculia bacterium]|nr:amino acid adenylation domain-containing protein [Thermoanaerobaculia bacterium]